MFASAVEEWEDVQEPLSLEHRERYEKSGRDRLDRVADVSDMRHDKELQQKLDQLLLTEGNKLGQGTFQSVHSLPADFFGRKTSPITGRETGFVLKISVGDTIALIERLYNAGIEPNLENTLENPRVVNDLVMERLRSSSSYVDFKNEFSGTAVFPDETMHLQRINITLAEYQQLVDPDISPNEAAYKTEISIPAFVSIQQEMPSRREGMSLAIGVAESYIREDLQEGRISDYNESKVVMEKLTDEFVFRNPNKQLTDADRQQLVEDLEKMGPGGVPIIDFINYYDQSDQQTREVMERFVEHTIRYTNKTGNIIDFFGSDNVRFLRKTTGETVCVFQDAFFPQKDGAMLITGEVLNDFATYDRLKAQAQTEEARRMLKPPEAVGLLEEYGKGNLIQGDRRHDVETAIMSLGYIRCINILSAYMGMNNRIDIKWASTLTEEAANAYGKGEINLRYFPARGKDLLRTTVSTPIVDTNEMRNALFGDQ